VNVVKEIRFSNNDDDDETKHPAVRVSIKTDEESILTNGDENDSSNNNSFHIKTTSQKSIKLAYEDILRLNLSTNDRAYLAKQLYFHPHSLSFSSIYEA
jgi:hypothetical protein